MIAGIDIGTSLSSITVLTNDDKIREISVSNGLSMIGDDYSLPSAVYVNENNEIIVGQSAMQTKLKKPSNYKDEFKRDLGNKEAYRLGNLTLYPEDLYKEIYSYLKACAERATNDKIEKAYITYPVIFSKSKKELIRTAAQNSGLLNVEMIEEPVAAALCYCQNDTLPDGCKLLIFDFGGGTFDATIVKYSNGNCEVCGTPSGLDDCGGSNIDEIIRFDIMSNIDEETLAAIASTPQSQQVFYSQLSEAAIRVKHLLSQTTEHTEYIPTAYNVIEYNITRADFENKIYALIEETRDCMLSALKQAQLKTDDIDLVIPVGGSSQIPLVQKMLTDIFGKEKVKNNINSKLAVCTGAVLTERKMKHNSSQETAAAQTSQKKNAATTQPVASGCSIYGAKIDSAIEELKALDPNNSLVIQYLNGNELSISDIEQRINDIKRERFFEQSYKSNNSSDIFNF